MERRNPLVEKLRENSFIYSFIATIVYLWKSLYYFRPAYGNRRMRGLWRSRNHFLVINSVRGVGESANIRIIPYRLRYSVSPRLRNQRHNTFVNRRHNTSVNGWRIGIIRQSAVYLSQEIAYCTITVSSCIIEVGNNSATYL